MAITPSKAISRQKWYDKLGYVPRQWQVRCDQAITAGHRYIGAFSFPRGGKSYWAARTVEPMLLEPDKHIWIVAPTYQLGSKEFGYIWTDLLEVGFLKMSESRHFDIRGGNMRIKFPWGSFVEVVSADNPSSLRAEELDALILSEASALPPEIFERHLFARAEKRKGIVLVPTTPKGYNWVYDSFRVPSQALLNGIPNPKYDPLYWSLVVSADPELGDCYEGGVYDDDFLARAKRTLPAPIYREQVGGDFASYAGLIYDYDPRVARVPRFAIPDWWTHVVGWDHGANAPTAIMCGSYSPEGVLYWWGEIYTVGKSAREYAALLRVLLGTKAPSAVVIDSSAKQVRIELSQATPPMTTTIPQDKQIDARIIRTTQMLREGTWKILDGTCPNLEQEIMAWEWDDVNPGKPRMHQRCHALDACGYAALATVAMPLAEEQDPFTRPGESPEQRHLWRHYRQRMAEAAAQEGADELTDILEDDPFAEIGLKPEAYQPEWA